MISLHHSDGRDLVVVLLASGDEFKGWEPGCRRACVVHRLSLAHHVLHLTVECSAHANMPKNLISQVDFFSRSGHRRKVQFPTSMVFKVVFSAL